MQRDHVGTDYVPVKHPMRFSLRRPELCNYTFFPPVNCNTSFDLLSNLESRCLSNGFVHIDRCKNKCSLTFHAIELHLVGRPEIFGPILCIIIPPPHLIDHSSAPRVATHSTVDGISHLEAQGWTILPGIERRLPVGELLVDLMELGPISVVKSMQYALLQTLDGRKGLSKGDVRHSSGFMNYSSVAISHTKRLGSRLDGLAEVVRMEVTLGELPLDRVVRTAGIFLHVHAREEEWEIDVTRYQIKKRRSNLFRGTYEKKTMQQQEEHPQNWYQNIVLHSLLTTFKTHSKQ